jgi:hypothetical protein
MDLMSGEIARPEANWQETCTSSAGMSVLHNKAFSCRLGGGGKRHAMRASLWVAVLGLIAWPGHAGQQGSQSPRGGSSGQTTVPQASPTSTPSHEAPPLPAASATPGTEPGPGETVAIDSALQTQIQDAFDKDPIFSRGGLKVTVLEDGIELSGDVASGRDRQNAARIAQSYARGKKVVNHVVVKGHTAQPGSTPPQDPPPNVSAPAGNRASSKNSPP